MGKNINLSRFPNGLSFDASLNGLFEADLEITGDAIVATLSTGLVKSDANGLLSNDTTVYYPNSNPGGYTTNTGTVTSISGSGGTTGLTLTGGAITTSGTLTLGGILALANGGTGSNVQNFVDLTTNQIVGGNKTLTGTLVGTTAAFTGQVSTSSGNFLLSGTTGQYFRADGIATARQGLLLTNNSSIELRITAGGSTTLGAFTEGPGLLVIGTGDSGGGGGNEAILFHSTGKGNMFSMNAATSLNTSYFPLTVNGILTGTTASLSDLTTSTPVFSVNQDDTGPIAQFKKSTVTLVSIGNTGILSGTGLIISGDVLFNSSLIIGSSGLNSWGSNWKPIQLGSNSFLVGRTDANSFQLGNNGYYDGTNWKYTANDASTRYYQSGGAHMFDRATSGTAGGTVTWVPVMTLNSSSLLRLHAYGAGALTTDASGNVTATSDERMKNIAGFYTTGLSALKNIKPITYKWKAETKLDTKEFYTGFSAQNIHQNIPQAAGKMANGDLTIQERPIMATIINAINELSEKLEKVEAEIVKLKVKL